MKAKSWGTIPLMGVGFPVAPGSRGSRSAGYIWTLTPVHEGSTQRQILTSASGEAALKHKGEKEEGMDNNATTICLPQLAPSCKAARRT